MATATSKNLIERINTHDIRRFFRLSHISEDLIVMDLIERYGHIHQRQLADKMEISLGYVNAILRRLRAKRYVRTYKAGSPNNVDYALTHSGQEYFDSQSGKLEQTLDLLRQN